MSYITELNKTLTLDSSKLSPINYNLSITNNNKEIIKDYSNEINDYVNYDEFNTDTINAFISIEDKDFYNHDGLNYKRMVGALINNVKNKDIVQGASTISQQLIKNTHLTKEKTIERKLKEMVLTKKLENTYEKDKIFEMYLNAIYFGEGAYGIKQASKKYFNKSVSNLTINESAVLAGLIKAPAYYSPITNLDKCIQRRNLVLNEMLEDKKISEQEYNININENIELNIQHLYEEDEVNSLYIKATLNEASNILNLETEKIKLSGYKIITYLDEEKNEILKKTITSKEFYPENQYGNTSDGLGLIINNQTNGIEAYAGKSYYDLTSFERQPGSAIKPILVYAPALDNNLIYTCSKILDEKININGYSPNNVGNTFSGYVTVRDSICKSLNIPAIKVMEKVGLEKCKEFASKSGIYFDNLDNNYAIALGGFTNGIDLVTLTNSFTSFANLGMYNQARFIKEIKDSNGNIIYKHNQIKAKIMKESTAGLMNDLLIDGVKKGTSKNLSNLPFQVAGKTGTVAVTNSNQNSDAISIAYTSKHTIGIWLGNYSNDTKFNLDSSNNGGTFATKIINKTMQNIYSNNSNKPENFIIPNSIISLYIDEKSLNENNEILLADDKIPDRYIIKELFAIDNKPDKYSELFNNYELEDLEIKYNENNNSINISFTPKDYLKYEIHSINNNKDSVLKLIENTNNYVNFDYYDINGDNIYDIYVKIYSIYNNYTHNTDNVKIITKSKIIEKINNDNWYFF